MKRICVCGHEEFRRTISLTQTLRHDGIDYEVTVVVDVWLCDRCGDEWASIDDEAGKVIDDELRRMAGIMSPEEMREHRARLGETVAETAKSIGVSKELLERWESGMQMQSRSADRFLRCYFGMKSLRDVLKTF